METFTIYPHMCDKQQEDIQQIIAAAHNLVECATSFAANGGQGWTSLLQARKDFEAIVIDTHKHYRRIAIVEVSQLKTPYDEVREVVKPKPQTTASGWPFSA